MNNDLLKKAQGKVLYSEQGKYLSLTGECTNAVLNKLVDSVWREHASVRDGLGGDV